MPSEFPGAPRLLKGALAVYPRNVPGTEPRIVVFQYNPETVRRSLAPRTQPPREGGNTGSAREDVLRVFGPPTETITLSVVLNAADQLGAPLPDPIALAHGLHPQLALLEMLMYPSSEQVRDLQRGAARGEVQLAAANVRLVLLVWGPARVVPVQVTSLNVVEEAFDPLLNPVQVKAELALKVLTNVEFPSGSLGASAYQAHHERKEDLASKAYSLRSGLVRGIIPRF